MISSGGSATSDMAVFLRDVANALTLAVFSLASGDEKSDDKIVEDMAHHLMGTDDGTPDTMMISIEAVNRSNGMSTSGPEGAEGVSGSLHDFLLLAWKRTKRHASVLTGDFFKQPYSERSTILQECAMGALCKSARKFSAGRTLTLNGLDALETGTVGPDDSISVVLTNTVGPSVTPAPAGARSVVSVASHTSRVSHAVPVGKLAQVQEYGDEEDEDEELQGNE